MSHPKTSGKPSRPVPSSATPPAAASTPPAASKSRAPNSDAAPKREKAKGKKKQKEKAPPPPPPPPVEEDYEQMALDGIEDADGEIDDGDFEDDLEKLIEELPIGPDEDDDEEMVAVIEAPPPPPPPVVSVSPAKAKNTKPPKTSAPKAKPKPRPVKRNSKGFEEEELFFGGVSTTRSSTSKRNPPVHTPAPPPPPPVSFQPTPSDLLRPPSSAPITYAGSDSESEGDDFEPVPVGEDAANDDFAAFEAMVGQLDGVDDEVDADEEEDMEPVELPATTTGSGGRPLSLNAMFGEDDDDDTDSDDSDDD